MKAEVSYNITINQEGKVTSLWLPLPFDTSYQKVLFVKYEGNYSQIVTSKETIYNTPMLYAEWKEEETKWIKVKMGVETQERVTEWSKIKKIKTIPEDVEIFLMPTKHIPIDGIVKEYTDKIITANVSTIEKVRAIYNWIVDNTYREPNVKGCGIGDVKSILKSGNFGGKCVDIGSIFVALVRAVGIPAREVFGIRVGESKISQSLGKTGNITTAQHCKAEFYEAGYGWIPVDPADVRKIILEENLPLEDLKVKNAREYLFGNWEDNWIAFNYARDFTLTPPQKKTPLNYFMYPYCEVDENPLDYFEPKTFSYEMFSFVD